MKKVLLYTLLVLGMGVKAQSNYFSFTSQLFFVASQVDGDNVSGFNKGGLCGGIGIQRVSGNAWDWGFELNYIQKGSRATPNIKTGYTNNYKFKLNYIEMPILFTRHFKRFNAQGGIAISRMISNSETINGIQASTPIDFHPIEVGSILGLEYEFNDRIKFVGRNSWSLSPIRSFRIGRTIYSWGQSHILVMLGLQVRMN